LATPVYPSEALKGRSGRVTVGVSITVDAEGRVSAIGSSLATFSTPSPHGPAFRQAVETAVRQWRFHPAQLQQMETKKASDGGDILVLKAVEPTDWTFDVAFTFTASGDVWSGLDHQGIEEKRSDGIVGKIRGFFVRLFSRRVL
jgi:TonB family protein